MMTKNSLAERRESIRAKRVLSIQFRLVKSNRKGPSKDWHLSTTYDMSVGGIAFYTDQEFKMGDILEVQVVMSGILDIYKGFGKVVRLERNKNAAHMLVAIQLLPKKQKGKTRQAKSYVAARVLKKLKSKKRI